MKIFRVFMNPTGEQWCDFQLPEHATAQTVWPQIMAEGVVSSPFAVVPRNAIHHALVLEIADQQTTLTVFPGGKPN